MTSGTEDPVSAIATDGVGLRYTDVGFGDTHIRSWLGGACGITRTLGLRGISLYTNYLPTSKVLTPPLPQTVVSRPAWFLLLIKGC